MLPRSGRTPTGGHGQTVGVGHTERGGSVVKRSGFIRGETCSSPAPMRWLHEPAHVEAALGRALEQAWARWI